MEYLISFIYFLVSFGILAGIYGVFTLGLNVHWGYTGLFNIGVAGFFALGAYTAALLTTTPPSPDQFEDFIFGGNLGNTLKLGIDLWFIVALAGAAAVSGIVALVVGGITLRLRDDYLAISTLGIAESVRLMFLNEKWLGNGSRGLYKIPKFLGDRVSPDQYDLLYFAVVIIVLAALYFAVQRAIDSPWGRVLRAIREDEEATAAAGKNVFRFKLQA
ncbi:MAG: branched-chain amino acid ABC transporter permease, partial [Chloroflexi bacterium]|nr:branched-chain amino acid ABC transporter permease [Chloroflexota bacterium]